MKYSPIRAFLSAQYSNAVLNVSGAVHQGYETVQGGEDAYARAWATGRLRITDRQGRVIPNPNTQLVPVPPEEFVARAMRNEPVTHGPYYAVFKGRVPGVYNTW